MPGLYDWILNSLRVDQSPATNQLPAPVIPQSRTALPVPFQNMASESVAPTIPAMTGHSIGGQASAGAAQESLGGKFDFASLNSLMPLLGGMGGQKPSKPPVFPVNVGNAVRPDFSQISPTELTAAPTSRSRMIMQMIQSGTFGDMMQ